MSRKTKPPICIPIIAADDDWFLSQDMTNAGTATSFSHDYLVHPGKIAFSHNHTASVTITVVYVRADDGSSYSESIAVANSDVAYTTYAATSLTSVTWSALAKTLKVGYQETAYIWYPGMSYADIVGAVFYPYSTYNSGDVNNPVPTAVAIASTPAAATAGYDNTSQCIFYNYPVDGSGYVQGGMLVLWGTQ